MASIKRRKDKKKRKQDLQASGKGPWPVTYKWVAMGTIVAYTAVGARTVRLASAQEMPGIAVPQSRKSPAQDNATAHRFEVAAGTLNDVLDTFEKMSGIHVLVPDERIRSITSQGVTGTYTNEQALDHLLKGTGIQYKFISLDTVKLSLTPLAQSVTVSGHVEGVGLTKYSQSVLDTPQTVSVVPQHIMQEQGTTTLRDALRNVAGISLAAGEGGSQGDNLTIRGFTARNDIFLDGMRDFGSYYRDPFDQESVAVLQGPSSVVFGRGSTGGVVSQTSKMPRPGGLVGGWSEHWYGLDAAADPRY